MGNYLMAKEENKNVNYFGLPYDLNASEVIQEIRLLSTKEKENHLYGGAYYQDALHDVVEMIKRLKG